MYKVYFKSLLDCLISLVGIMILSPVFLTVFLALLIVNNGKVFFMQKRPGKNGKIFTIIKFRTMNDKKDNQGNLLSDAERLTDIGKVVRKTNPTTHQRTQRRNEPNRA